MLPGIGKLIGTALLVPAVLILLLLTALRAPDTALAAPLAQALQETVGVESALRIGNVPCGDAQETLYLDASDLDAIVYPCYTVENSGTHPISVTITVDRGGADLPDLEIAEFVVEPGDSQTQTTQTESRVTTARDFTSEITIQEILDDTGEEEEGEEAPTPQTFTRVAVNAIVAVSPQIALTTTVGQDPDACSDQTSAVVPNNGTAYFCIQLENRGDITLTQHSLAGSLFSGTPAFEYALAPQATLVITNGTLAELGISGNLVESNISCGFERQANVTSQAIGGHAQDTANDTAGVSVSSATVTMVKTLNFNPSECSDLTNAQTGQETPFFYCVRITNTGEAPLTTHTLDEFRINIDTTFDYPLEPGAVLELTNQRLEEIGVEPTLGPFFIYQGPNNIVNFTLRYTGTNEIGNVASAQANAVMGPLPTATPTPTSPPQSMPTLTPFPTYTPTATPIPDTPTPTETPIPDTPTPTSTFTPDLRVGEVETPTPDPAANGQPAAPAAPESPLEPGTEPDSPLPQPTETPIETPTATPTEMPIETSTETPTATATPTDMPTATPVPPTPTATETPEADDPEAVARIVVTNTPAPESPLGLQGQRPIVPPTPAPTPDMLMLFARTIDSAATAAVWIWFLAGSLVFFATAGIVAGLFFRHNERRRYDLLPMFEEDYADYQEDEWEDETDLRRRWPRDLP